jgi:hypothetical protein
MDEAISQPQVPLRTEQDWSARLFPNNEWILLIVIAVECLLFAFSGNNFATTGNAFEITRLSVEIGLLALIMTPIIITGGIDLSVGSMMGLSAVVMGGLWRDGRSLDAGRDCDHTRRRTIGRSAKRGDDHEAQSSAAYRDTRYVLAVSRYRRRTYTRNRELLGILAILFISWTRLCWRCRTDTAIYFRPRRSFSFGGGFIARRLGAVIMRSDSRRKDLVTPGSRSAVD